MSLLNDVGECTALLQSERADAERGYAMTEPVMERLGPLGVFRLMASDRSVSVGEYIRILEMLSYGDPSVAWAAANSNGAAQATHILPDDVRAEMLAEGNWFYGVGFPPSGKALRSPGSLRVSGRWPVVSGCEHATHFVLNCVIVDDGAAESSVPDMTYVVVPRSAVSIDRTWVGVNAVRGSGSHAVTVDGYVASDTACASLADFIAVSGTPGLTGQSLWLAAVAVGIGRAAVDGAIEQASSRVSISSGRSWRDYPSTQNSVASADAAVHAARAGLFALADRTDKEMAERGMLDRRTHARLHANCDHAFRTVRDAVSGLFTTGSVDAVRSGHVLEQSLRDIHGFSVQWERYRHLHYHAGKSLLGGDIEDPLY